MALKDQKLIRAITPYMKGYSFKRKGRFFYKLLEDLVFCVEFEKPGEIIYMNYYVVPLYMPHEFRCFTYGNRVVVSSDCIGAKPEQEVNEGEITECVSQIQGYMETIVLPLFEAVSTPRKLVEAVSKNVRNTFFCTDIDALRIHLFTYAYLGEYKKFMKIEKKYRCVLRDCDFLTDAVKEMYWKEIETIQAALQVGETSLSNWFDETIRNTLTVIL